MSEKFTPTPATAPVDVPVATPAQAYASAVGSQSPNGAPVHVVRRDNAAIEQYQREIKENEIGCSDICWFLFCGPFALICCLPKYNRQQEMRRKIDIELAKPL
ncbi:hypothetical protein BGZ73_000571 [Actinomortierella ambigua]|nr:hypothetical protein BGZ73_000571 [Actinomortierella ambigua]